MAQLSFNATQYSPEYGGGGGLPPGQKYKGVIVHSSLENNKQGNGGYLELEIVVIEGPLKDQTMKDRLNLLHPNAQTVAIANKQLAAYCAVIGVHMFNDTQELHNKPFMFDVGFQKGHEPSQEKPAGGYTEIKALYDMNGNKPGQAGAGPQNPQQAAPPPPQQPPAGVGATGGGAGGWGGGQPQGQPAPQQQQPQQQPAPQGGNGGGWGGGQPQQQPQQTQPQPQGNGGAGGWQQNGAGGAGGWNNR